MTVSLTPEFEVGGELNFFKDDWLNKLPNKVKNAISDSIGIGGALHYQLPI